MHLKLWDLSDIDLVIPIYYTHLATSYVMCAWPTRRSTPI